MHVDHRALVEIATGESLIDSGIRLNDAGREAAEYLAERYEEAGLMNVRVEEFETTRWWPETYGVTVVGDAGEMDLNAFPVWYCGSANNLELEVVYAGFGTGREFPNVAGKAVLIDMKRILHFTPTWMPLQAQNQAITAS